MMIDIRQAIYKFNTASFFKRWLIIFGTLFVPVAAILLLTGLITAVIYAKEVVFPKEDVWLPDGAANMIQYYTRPDGSIAKLQVVRLGGDKWLGRILDNGTIVYTNVQSQASPEAQWVELVACQRYWPKSIEACSSEAAERLQ